MKRQRALRNRGRHEKISWRNRIESANFVNKQERKKPLRYEQKRYEVFMIKRPVRHGHSTDTASILRNGNARKRRVLKFIPAVDSRQIGFAIDVARWIHDEGIPACQSKLDANQKPDVWTSAGSKHQREAKMTEDAKGTTSAKKGERCQRALEATGTQLHGCAEDEPIVSAKDSHFTAPVSRPVKGERRQQGASFQAHGRPSLESPASGERGRQWSK